MSQKILWDEDEALILLDALLQVLSGALSRKDAVALVSKGLRIRAIYKGFAIDDIFRNRNGIHSQMSVMEYAYTEGKRGLKQHKVPKPFQDVVFLYKNDRPTYEKRLAEAEAVVVLANTLQVCFLEWLARKIPFEKISEFYAVCADVDRFCIQEGVLNGSLFETADLDLVEHMLQTAGFDEEAQFADDRRNSKRYSVLQLYHKFLKENGDEVQTVISPMNGEPAWRTMNYSKAQNISANRYDESVDGLFYIDFDCIENMAYTSPQILEYAGRKTEYRKWSRLYIVLVSQLRAKYEDIFTSEAEREASSSAPVMVVSEEMKANFRIPRSIGGGMYVEGNCSATKILKNIRFFLELCNVDFSSVAIQYVTNAPRVTLGDNRNAPQPSGKSHPQFSRELMSIAEMILADNFGNGMRKNAAIAKRKFQKSYLDLTGEALPESVDIDELASAVSVEYAGKFYVVSKANKQKLRELVLAAVSTGNRVMFYEEIYRQHLDFMAEASIFSANLLKIVLKQILPDMRYKRTFFSPTNGDSLEKDIINCFGDEPTLTYNEIKQRLLYACLFQIRLVCSRSSKFVRVKEETYALTDRIRFSQFDIDHSLDTISKDIKHQGFSVFQRISVSESVEWNPDVSEAAVREAMYSKHLAPFYDKKHSIITPLGASFNPSMVMVEYCKGLCKATLPELQTYEAELTERSTYSLSAAYNTMIRVDQEHFVRSDAIEFDVPAIDDALSLFVQDNIVSLMSVKSFTSFPEVDGYPWNLFLLDSFCRHKSMRFRTMGGPAKRKPVGAIFPIQMQFDSYETLLAQVVAESGLILRTDVVAEFLTKNSYTLRRIETGEIISKAQEIRLQEGIADV